MGRQENVLERGKTGQQYVDDKSTDQNHRYEADDILRKCGVDAGHTGIVFRYNAGDPEGFLQNLHNRFISRLQQRGTLLQNHNANHCLGYAFDDINCFFLLEQQTNQDDDCHDQLKLTKSNADAINDGI